MVDRIFEAVAYHEAGHAVASLCFGRPVDLIWVDLNSEKYEVGKVIYASGLSVWSPFIKKRKSRKHWVRIVHEILIAMHITYAGPISESEYLNTDCKPLLFSQGDGDKIIYLADRLSNMQEGAKNLDEVPDCLCEDWLDVIETETREMLLSPDNIRATVFIAESLLRKQELTGEELMSLLDSAFTPPLQLPLFETCLHEYP